MFEKTRSTMKISTSIADIPMDLFRFDEIEGFTISCEQAIKAIGETKASLREFLKSVPSQTLVDVKLVNENIQGELTLQTTTGYWLIQALKGNAKAQALIFALACDSFSNRAEIEFGFREGDPKIESLRKKIDKLHCITWLTKDVPHVSN